MAKRHVGDQRLLPDSKANPAIESLCRAVARADAEAKLSKLAADDARDRLAAELKKLPVPAYLRGPIRCFIERKEKVAVEVDDETGEA